MNCGFWEWGCSVGMDFYFYPHGDLEGMGLILNGLGWGFDGDEFPQVGEGWGAGFLNH